MAEDAPKSPKQARPAKKAAAPKARAISAKPSKGSIVDDTGTTPLPQSESNSGATKAPHAKNAPSSAATTGVTVQSLKDSAAAITKNVGDKAKAYAEDNKSRAGGALDDLARMIHDAAGTVDEKVGPQYGQYARTAADAVTGFSDSLKAKNVDDLIADATGFVKKSPAIAIGAAAAIGFVLIRLVQSGLNADTTDRS